MPISGCTLKIGCLGRGQFFQQPVTLTRHHFTGAQSLSIMTVGSEPVPNKASGFLVNRMIWTNPFCMNQCPSRPERSKGRALDQSTSGSPTAKRELVRAYRRCGQYRHETLCLEKLAVQNTTSQLDRQAGPMLLRVPLLRLILQFRKQSFARTLRRWYLVIRSVLL